MTSRSATRGNIPQKKACTKNNPLKKQCLGRRQLNTLAKGLGLSELYPGINPRYMKVKETLQDLRCHGDHKVCEIFINGPGKVEDNVHILQDAGYPNSAIRPVLRALQYRPSEINHLLNQ